MSRGNKIVITPDRGFEVEGIIASGQTPKPGTILQKDPTVALQGGRFTWKLYNRGADGKRPAGPFIVLQEDRQQGKTMSDAYAAGDRAFGFIPLAGCELNLLYEDVAGTGDTHTAGELGIVDDVDGKIIATTGSPQTEVCMILETITSPTGDFLAWVEWTGY